jgi:hypothetical protein
MSKTSNHQKLHVLKTWLDSFKVRKPKPVMKKTYLAYEED